MKWALLALFLFPSISYGAIAFDSESSSGSQTSSSATWSHTVSGSDTILFVSGMVRPAGTVSSITYNGDAMTLVNATDNYLNSDVVYLYYLVNPDAGTHNIVATLSGSYLNVWESASYTGVLQTAPVTSYSSDRGDGSSNNFTITASTTVANSWVITNHRSFDGVCTAGANTVIRGTEDVTLSDTGVAQSIGSPVLNFSSCGNRVGSKMWASFAPALALPPIDLTSTSTEIRYQDWLLMNTLIVMCLSVLVYGVLFSPVKR